ncbi:MAG: AMP-binding protein [Congregibacter sp.]
MSANTAGHPPWFDGKTPSADDCVLPTVVRRRAEQTPDLTLASFESGEQWTCHETSDRMMAAAELLSELGVSQADRVVAWLPNGPELLQLWLACNYLGAIVVPLNTDFRGSILAHALRESDPRLLVLHPRLTDRLETMPDELPARVVVCGEIKEPSPPGTSGARWDYRAELPKHPRATPVPAELGPWDLMMVIFTSGTTGASKGVLCPYGHIYSTAKATYGYINAEDTMLTELPIFHVGGAASVTAALCSDARLAIYSSFSTQDYWPRIKRESATTTSGLIGSMADFLAQSPPSPDDASNSLRAVTLMLTEQAMRVAKRFDFQTLTGFNMTELSGPLITELDCQIPGSLGRPRDGCECRVVDDRDMPCAEGEIGELIVRSDYPWTIFAGYLNRPEATADAWRNGWFHTGDLVRRDTEGNYFFVDRKKDAIRRRGENVSSNEVEAEALQHPGVAEACAVAVPSELAEDEILLAYVVVANADSDSLSSRELAEFLIPRMPHFMVPRFFKAVQSLPRTPTNKVRKVELRDAGITDDCWDREAEGMRLKRTRFN